LRSHESSPPGFHEFEEREKLILFNLNFNLDIVEVPQSFFVVGLQRTDTQFVTPQVDGGKMQSNANKLKYKRTTVQT